MQKSKFQFKNQNHLAGGFTLIELLLVIGLFAILSTFTVINLIRPQTKSLLDATVVTLTADLKEQQLKSIVGDSEGVGSASTYGIYFESNRYTLFKGSSYISSDPTNFTVPIETTVSLANNLPLSQIVFSRRSGEFSGFINGSNTITLSETSGNSKIVTLNRLGTVSVN